MMPIIVSNKFHKKIRVMPNHIVAYYRSVTKSGVTRIDTSDGGHINTDLSVEEIDMKIYEVLE